MIDDDGKLWIGVGDRRLGPIAPRPIDPRVYLPGGGWYVIKRLDVHGVGPVPLGLLAEPVRGTVGIPAGEALTPDDNSIPFEGPPPVGGPVDQRTGPSTGHGAVTRDDAD